MIRNALKPIHVHLLGDAIMIARAGTVTPSGKVVFALALILTLDRDKQPSRRYIEELLWGPGSQWTYVEGGCRTGRGRMIMAPVPLVSGEF
jgi:hypothetical protein